MSLKTTAAVQWPRDDQGSNLCESDQHVKRLSLQLRVATDLHLDLLLCQADVSIKVCPAFKTACLDVP